MVASSTRNTSYPARLISPIAAAMRSESDNDSLIALPNSCISSFSFSSTRCPFLGGPLQAYHYLVDVSNATTVSTKFLVSQASGSALPFYISAQFFLLVSAHRLRLRYTDNISMLSKAKRLMGYVLPGVIRPIHILWNQVIGFFFLVLALLPVPSAIRSFGKDG